MTSNPAIISIIGSLNVDLVTRTPRVPLAGETLTAESFSTGYGGKGGNQAVACARLSRTESQASNSQTSDMQVRMVGAVGDDNFAAGFLESLKGDGLDVSGVRVVEGESTGTAVIVVETGSGQNRILFCPGANYRVEKGDLLKGDEGVAVFQLELKMDVVTHNMKLARERKIEVVLNPAPAIPLDEDMYRGLGHLIVNETEAEILSGVSGSKSLSDWDEVAGVFIARGVENIIITLGSDGVVYQTAERAAQSLQAKQVPARKVQVVDTTAAGDTFVGAYSVAVARWKQKGTGKPFDIDAAINFANRASSMTVQKKGAQSSIPWANEVPES